MQSKHLISWQSATAIALASLPIKWFNPVAEDGIALAPLRSNPGKSVVFSKAWASSVVNYSLKKLKAKKGMWGCGGWGWSGGGLLESAWAYAQKSKNRLLFIHDWEWKKNIDCIVLRQQFNYVSWPAATNLPVFTYVEDFF